MENVRGAQHMGVTRQTQPVFFISMVSFAVMLAGWSDDYTAP
jgi:hypothetical protein